MSSTKIYGIVNDLMNIEYKAHYHYMQASSWAAYNNLDGCHSFLLNHAQEEYSHVMRVFKYLIDAGYNAVFYDLPKPEIKSDDVESLFSSIYQHEIIVTKAYDDALISVSEEKDNQTFCFLQWFVNEQIEEITLCRNILDKIKLIGSGPHSLYLIDLEIGKMAKKS
ncbi:ferritin [Candidatus Liberibacter americanus]|uniref:Ferritin n=1 Tax=Candidatus Liberibacter americanus str. Sao Paulo TaxID=1261131 RepID=U6B3T8_9HYPH|nr:ferritin-like domain-containing protein [Candidatus Liberibacter americanus]AHA27605.1 Ferritin-like protein [Candidatus Liberibacter americanus str. Sao Paulo]EMS36313.1 ferroxidase [Candidatus Liberibacter americanus PW_SP]